MNDSITAEERQNYYLLRIEVKFNIATINKIQKVAECAIKPGRNTIIFDFEKVTHIDKHGIDCLLPFIKNSRQAAEKYALHLHRLQYQKY
jgi:anti-anti-sigma regulatory factor